MHTHQRFFNPCWTLFLKLLKPEALGLVSEALGLVSEALGLVSEALGLVSEALGLVSEALGLVSEALGLVSEALGLVSEALGLVSEALGLVSPLARPDLSLLAAITASHFGSAAVLRMALTGVDSFMTDLLTT